MNFIKVRNNALMKSFVLTVLIFFMVGMLSVPLQAYQNSGVVQKSNVIEYESQPATLAEALLLTICIAQLDISQEEKAEVLAEVLGYDCEEINALVILFDELDNFFPPLKIVTEILRWIYELCLLIS